MCTRNLLLVVNIVFPLFHGIRILSKPIYHIHTYQSSNNINTAGDNKERFSFGTIAAEGASVIVPIGR